jgi:hypothetical protein
MAEPKPLVEEIGEGALWLGSNGQGLGAVERDPVVIKNRPGRGSGFDTAHLVRYDGTDFCQWQGRRSDGCFHASGKILRLTAAGKRALRKARGDSDAR